MVYLTQLTWYPQIHRDIVTLAQKCKQCNKPDQNLKPIIPKNKIVDLPRPSESNEEVQMDFARPITSNNRDTYILVTIDEYSDYPNAEAYNNCDTETTLTYLNEYENFPGIPRPIGCDQAQAFKAKKSFEIFSQDNDMKLMLAPPGVHRATVWSEFKH